MSIFDLVDEKGNIVKDVEPEPKQGSTTNETVFDVIDEAEPTKKNIPWWQSIPADALKGFLESVSKAGRMMGPIPTYEPERDLQKRFSERLDEMIPSDNTFLGQAIRRGENLAGPAMMFPGGATQGVFNRSMAGGVTGQAAEHVGLPEWAQLLAELGPQFAPNMGRQIPLTGEQRQLGEFGRRAGLAEEELALSLGQRNPVRDVAEAIAPRGGRTVQAVDRTRDALGRVFNTLEEAPIAARQLTGEQSANFLNEVSNRLSRLPAETRNRIMQDYNDLVSSNMSGRDLINFWQDLNYYIANGERSLGTLKDPIMRAINNVSPVLGQDFRLSNQLYQNFANQARRLNPDMADRLFSLGESGAILHAVTTGNYPILQKILGPVAGRQVARELVVNPRFQNLGNRIIQSLNEGKFGIAKNAIDKMTLMLSKENPEAAKYLSDKEIRNFLESSTKEANNDNKVSE